MVLLRYRVIAIHFQIAGRCEAADEKAIIEIRRVLACLGVFACPI
jgi:hypothetical protein